MKIREIQAGEITEAVAALCISANCNINLDIINALKKGLCKETTEFSKNVIQTLLENAKIAKTRRIPICQDTGMTVIFVEIGQDVHIIDGSLPEAIQKGVAEGYEKGYLRKSIVKDPINRINTNNNTPAIIHYDIISGDRIKITVMPKGFGSENMSTLAMLMPSAGIEGVKKFVMDTVKQAGANPCPPIIAGVGIGGTMEKAALLAKQGLLQELGRQNNDSFWAEIEKELLAKINETSIGPGGFSGKTTALAVHINVFPTHIAGLPVAVNIGCHATRHATVIL